MRRNATQIQILYRLEYTGFRILVWILRALPLEVASNLSGKGWRLIAPLLKRHKRALEGIATAFPQSHLSERERIARDMWENLGRVFAESFRIPEIVNTNRIALENADAIKSELAEEPCFVVAGLHLGNWEAGMGLAPALGARVCGIYQRVRNPFVEKFILDIRTPLYTAGLFPKQEDAAKKVMQQLRGGASVALMGDLRDQRGINIHFFGKTATSNIFPALLARTMKVPLYAVRVARVPRHLQNVQFRVRFVRIAIPNTEDRKADAISGTVNLQTQFETFIREYPGQWMWSHRRWG